MKEPLSGYLVATLLAASILTVGCVRRTAITQDYGLSGNSATQRPAKDRTAQKPSAATADADLRALFRQQTEGAFNPLTDDRRVQMLQNRLTLNSADLQARLELAAIFENYHLSDDALEQFSLALPIARSTPATEELRSEEAALGIARSARAAHRSAEVIPVLEGFLKDSPSANAWNELGLLYDEAGDLAAGERAFRAAIVSNPQSHRPHNNLGYNLLMQNKTDAAEVELRRALELNSKSANTRNNLGALLARRGDLAGALEQFQATADAATAHNNLAVILMESGQYEQSRAELVKALTIRHYFAPALANFKLLQERIRARAESPKAGAPLSAAQSTNPEDR